MLGVEAGIICTIFCIFILISFLKGIEIGQKLNSGTPIEVKSPLKAIKKYKEEKAYERKQEEIDSVNAINLYNIDSYDGTELGQRDFE